MVESTNPLIAIINWLRQGYADGVPPQDYVPLLEVLHRRLTDGEVDAIVTGLLELDDSPIAAEDISRATTEWVLQRASAEDVARVASRLESVGAPVIGVATPDLAHLEVQFDHEASAVAADSAARGDE